MGALLGCVVILVTIIIIIIMVQIFFFFGPQRYRCMFLKPLNNALGLCVCVCVCTASSNMPFFLMQAARACAHTFFFFEHAACSVKQCKPPPHPKTKQHTHKINMQMSCLGDLHVSKRVRIFFLKGQRCIYFNSVTFPW